MSRLGLLVRLEARKGQDEAVEAFLGSALTTVRQETGTTAWFAIRFGRSRYGIFDVFPDEQSRELHLQGPVVQAIMNRADELFAKPPEIHRLEVLADKLPADYPGTPDRKGLLLILRPKPGNERGLEEILRGAKTIVDEEAKTTAWFAIRLDSGEYGIFDVFPDNASRLKHLTGRVPRALLKRARQVLGGMPRMDLVRISAEKLPEPSLA